MIGNVEALKVLYKKLGGSLTDTYSDIAGGIPVVDYDLIADCILACAKKGSGGSLPTPGTAGNVLTSTGDGWESAAPRGGDNDFLINADVNEYFRLSNFTHDGESVDKNAVTAAFNSGKQVYIVAAGTGEAEDTYISIAMSQHTGDVLVFSGIGIIPEGNVPKWRIVSAMIVSLSEGVTLQISDTLPIAINSDIGKLLMVNSNRSYELVSPSDLSNAPLIVHGTISGSDFAFTDTTVKDVYDAKTANRAVFLDDGDGFRWELTGATLDTSTYSISFGCLKHGATKIIAAIIGISGTAETTTGGGVIESDLTPNT